MAQITIDLDKARRQATDTLPPEQLLQIDALHEVLNRLCQIGQEHDADESSQPDKPEALSVHARRRHDAILVDAPRGGGKTTFLAGLLSALESANTDVLKYATPRALDPRYQDADFSNNDRVKALQKLYSLGLIDPTTVEETQNIMVMIIDRVHRAVLHGAQFSSKSGEYDAYERALRDLARAVWVLPGVRPDHIRDAAWTDPDFVLDEGLETANAMGSFEGNFHTFLQKACNVLGVNAFVLAIDDVDTWFERGWPVLEALRKYLTTPKLRLILSGDMRLFTLLVRSQQWRQMGPELLKNESWIHANIQDRANDPNGHPDHADPDSYNRTRSRMVPIVRTINVLQDQYLNKVLPPAGRVRLQGLHELAHVHTIVVQATDRVDTKRSIKLRDATDRYIEHILAFKGPGRLKRVRTVLHEAAFRTVLHILSGAGDAVFDEAAENEREDAKNGKNEGQSGKREPTQPDFLAMTDEERYFRRLRAVRALVNANWSEIQNLDFSPEVLLDNHDIIELMVSLVQWFTENQIWVGFSRLFPDHRHVNTNLAVTAVNACVVHGFCEQPRGIVEYWLKIAAPANLIESWNLNNENVENLIDQTKLRTHEDAVITASRLGAWVQQKSLDADQAYCISLHSIPLSMLRGETVQKYIHDIYGINWSQWKALISDIRENCERQSNKIKWPRSVNHVDKIRNIMEVVNKRRKNGIFAYAICLHDDEVSIYEKISGFTEPRRPTGLVKELRGRSEHLAAMAAAYGTASGDADEKLFISFSRIVGSMSLFFDVSTEVPDGDISAMDELLRWRLRQIEASRRVGVPYTGGTVGPIREVPRGPAGPQVPPEASGLTPDVTELRGQPNVLAKALRCWLQATAVDRRDTTTPITLARIWERAAYMTSTGPLRGRDSDAVCVGDHLHEQIVNLLHAALVAIRDPNEVETPLSMRNDPEFFVDAARHYLYEDDKFNGRDSSEKVFFDRFLTFPLWGFFLRPYKLEDWSEFKPFHNITEIEQAKRMTKVYELYLERARARYGDAFKQATRMQLKDLFTTRFTARGLTEYDRRRPVAVVPNLYDVLNMVLVDT